MKMVSVRLSEELYNKLVIHAKKQGCSVSDIIRKAVIHYCNNNHSRSIMDILPKLAESVQKAIKESLNKEV